VLFLLRQLFVEHLNHVRVIAALLLAFAGCFELDDGLVLVFQNAFHFGQLLLVPIDLLQPSFLQTLRLAVHCLQELLLLFQGPCHRFGELYQRLGPLGLLPLLLV
jgi:hypothetical protein